MASTKIEKPVQKSCCSASSGQAKKEPAAKPSESTPKALASKPAPKKAEQKSQSKQKASSSN